MVPQHLHEILLSSLRFLFPITASMEPEEAKLDRFLQWLQANGAELRGCSIRCCGPNNGFGVFLTETPSGIDNNGVVMVVPLDLAITPMRVLQDPTVGPRCRALFEEGDVDDRFLVMLFLIVERLRPDSLWKPYLDMLPSTFGSPLWFTEDELSALKGTTLHRATVLQRKSLEDLFRDKMKGLIEELLCSNELQCTREIQYEDFLWANSIFWTRALNIPFPHFYVFPESSDKQDHSSSSHDSDSCAYKIKVPSEASGEDTSILVEHSCDNKTSNSRNMEHVWVEGLLPGIDFCNHGWKAVATWEVDPTGAITGVPASMYLVLVDQGTVDVEKEIHINYGNKGNEELLYLYGFVVDNNPDDFLMIHYPVEALQNVPLADRKAKLLEIQKAELRCLLPKTLLDRGFFSSCPFEDIENKDSSAVQISNYSWSGQRMVPSYVNKLVFPQEFIMALRTITMQEHEFQQVSSLLGELVGSGEDRQLSDREVQTAIWEVCGDYGALQLLVDLLHVKMTELEEGSGSEAVDNELLEKFEFEDLEDDKRKTSDDQSRRNHWSSIVYRRGQKQLTSLFLREAEHALELCAKEQS
ncbi:protein-lysine N-methyltransferase EFM1 isoform X2 [Typha angustifolia]|uniref:protein-lysine N-methyltransferase EFM1 isoform X2 n=1 Tax=Typha angustifolia TaxID=59011 RepID=UPI003C2F62F1